MSVDPILEVRPVPQDRSFAGRSFSHGGATDIKTTTRSLQKAYTESSLTRDTKLRRNEVNSSPLKISKKFYEDGLT
ncbi:hypothetical protein N7449_005953 [Penicillium cf. viridicatum]|uniref:Uncharacterized protein n=1 Tax=Penicillium cf. viridicatum TaxID=2972119 RepID=A0A9W9MGZ6_9EURO|nr:hypothetical protein N7449_005953 [Penicillium cf. viridicatum]